ncbi:MAG: argininosuccinate lyase 1 [Candidatus Tectimicrobiota bacterium]|nr:MAG: argininosuccinate lyase 1 [Candidatus Tectomicrobia bacterium]
MASPSEPVLSRCRLCGEPQPARGWRPDTPADSLLQAWERAAPLQRYCGLCLAPACDDDTLDRLQGEAEPSASGRLYGSGLVSPTPEVVAFMAGWDVAEREAADEALIPFDLWVNRAHARMLVAQGLLSAAQGEAILAGLREIERRYRCGQFRLLPAREDVHTNIETFLTAELGISAALALHTARSRNDQVLTDMRLWMRARVLNLARLCLDFLRSCLAVARQHCDSAMAGYTHHQHATVSTFGHLLAAYAEAVRRVVQRLHGWYETFNYSPLGCVTGFGTTLPIDRHLTAELLGFAGPEPNTLDPVTSRWEPEAELAHILAVLLTHLSGLAQTLMLFSTQEFGVLKLHPRFCSGSSIMPHKVNPDTLEVVKARASEVTGRLGTLLSLGRASLAGYNRDQQWSKYAIMEACREGLPAVSIMSRLVAHACRPLAVNPWLGRPVGIDTARLQAMAASGFTGVTELMEQLVVRTGIPLRRLKPVMERAVALSLQQGEEHRVTPAALHQACQEAGLEMTVAPETVWHLQEPATLLAAKQVYGGPGRQALEAELAALDAFVAAQQRLWQERDAALQAKEAACRQLA